MNFDFFQNSYINLNHKTTNLPENWEDLLQSKNPGAFTSGNGQADGWVGHRRVEEDITGTPTPPYNSPQQLRERLYLFRRMPYKVFF